MPSNREIVDSMYAFATRDDVDGMLSLITDDFELDVSKNVFNPAVWRGSEGGRQWIAQAREVWEDPEFTVERVVDLPGGSILSVVVISGSARLSGVRLDNRLWHVWEFRDGLVSRCAHYNDEASAFRDAGPAAE